MDGMKPCFLFSEMQSKIGVLIREILFLTEGKLCVFILKDKGEYFRVFTSAKLLENYQPKVTTFYSESKIELNFVKFLYY